MRNYMLSFNEKEASALRGALHIAVNLLAVSGYSGLREVRQTANNLHRMMVGWGVPLSHEVLAFESVCHGPITEAFKKEAVVPVPKPEPERWEVQTRMAGTSYKWRRSDASRYMKDHTRASAYLAMHQSGVLSAASMEYRVAKVGDYDHVPGTYRVEARRPGESWKPLSGIWPISSWNDARTCIATLKAYGSGADFRTVFTPVK